MWVKNQETVYGALGAGTGYVLAEVPAEYLGTLSAQTGWYRVGVKAIVKIIIGALMLMGSRRASPLNSTFMKVGAFAGMGTILIDIIGMLIPGGLPAIAQMISFSSRTMSVGARAVSNSMQFVPQVQVQGAGTRGGYI